MFSFVGAWLASIVSCRPVRRLLAAAMPAVVLLTGVSAGAADPTLHVPILLYHRFGPAVTDDMTVTTPVFEAQFRLLQDRGFRVIPLQALVESLGAAATDCRAALTDRAVVLTVDDGHRTVYTDLFPLIQRYRVPVTLFIYPSAISNASYALTWEQLAEMKASGLVDVQSHTYWHPNFNVERRRLGAPAYERFVQDQLVKSKAVLDQRLGGKVDLLAWPFGIYDAQLIQWASAAGYAAAFSIERRAVTRAENLMALPRYIVTDADRGARFETLLSGPNQQPAPKADVVRQ
jgi:peptidoglycan/xylan/chitin deacetylase (PgdA/CDA1 family)